jgi:hypothetical protein
MSRLKTVRDQATAAIAALAAVTARSITPEAVWTPPERDRAELTTAEILVAPATREVQLVGRGNKTEAITIQAAIFDPLEQGTEDTTADNDQTLAEAIIDGLLTTRLAAGYTCTAATQPNIRDVDHWRTKRLFTSYVELVFES